MEVPKETNKNVPQASGIEKKNTRTTSKQQQLYVASEFLSDFDPDKSEREKRKLHRKLTRTGKKIAHNVYNDKGIYLKTGENLCDCLDRSCNGCHFPCPKCSSRKCGHECRSKRKWIYESIEIEGSDNVIKNPILNESAI